METDEPGSIGQRQGVSPDAAASNKSCGHGVLSGGTSAPTHRPERSGNEEVGWADERLKSILESLLFAAGEPVSLPQLANAIEDVPRERIRKLLNEMASSYASSSRGFALEEIAGGYQLRTRSEHAVYVRRLLSAKPPRLSRPVLETLAIVAYRQPITRPEIEQLRGVDSGGVLDNLMERDLIKIVGRKDAPGRPLIYVTTAQFLELFGLKDLESLPDLEELREVEDSHNPTEAADTSQLVDLSEDVPFSGEPAGPEQPILSEESSDPCVVPAQDHVHEASPGNPAKSNDPVAATAGQVAKTDTDPDKSY
jgi:segregation and condensation protein B